MKKIYCITEWDNNMNQEKSELFLSLEGIANWLTNYKPIDHVFHVSDRETEGDYDITAKNLMNLMEASKTNGTAAAFTIKRDFFFQTIETRFTLSCVNVND